MIITIGKALSLGLGFSSTPRLDQPISVDARIIDSLHRQGEGFPRESLAHTYHYYQDAMLADMWFGFRTAVSYQRAIASAALFSIADQLALLFAKPSSR